MPAATHVFEVTNDIHEVARLSEALGALWAQRELPPEGEMDATLALEEILSNVIRHGFQPGQASEIRVRVSFEPSAYEIEVIDNAAPYNPLLREDPDLNVPIAQRRPGGLGIFLVKKLADELRYDYRDGRNHLVFRKNLPA